MDIGFIKVKPNEFITCNYCGNAVDPKLKAINGIPPIFGMKINGKFKNICFECAMKQLEDK